MKTVREVIQRMQQEVAQAQAKKGKIDQRLAPEHQRAMAAEIDAELVKELVYWRERGEELIDRQRKEADIGLHKTRQERRPQGAAGWAEAQARAGFVQADVEGLEPTEISNAYQLAKVSGDGVGAWLIARAGLARLDALGKVPADVNDLQAINEAMNYARLAEKLRDTVYGPAQKVYRKRSREIDQQAYQLHQPVHEWEEQQQVQAVADRYGIRTHAEAPAAADGG